jgi:hypothetical protein
LYNSLLFLIFNHKEKNKILPTSFNKGGERIIPSNSLSFTPLGRGRGWVWVREIFNLINC